MNIYNCIVSSLTCLMLNNNTPHLVQPNTSKFDVVVPYSIKEATAKSFQRDISVRNAKGLIDALKVAKAGDRIRIVSNIDMTGYKDIQVPGGVTIYGKGKQNGVGGPQIYTNSHGVHPLFEVTGPKSVFSGLRIRGADGEVLYKGRNAFTGKSAKEKKEQYTTLYKENMYATSVSSAIATKYDDLLIENCELYQWTYTAVYLKKGATNAIIKKSFIHHNQRFGLGYGITVDQASAVIEENLFNYNRHSIASTGRAGSSYVARNNVFKEGGNDTWAVDMHGGTDRGDGTTIAGTQAIVKNNTFYLKGSAKAFVIRGKSKELSEVSDNKIIKMDDDSDNVIEQRNGSGNLMKSNNVLIRNGRETLLK